MLSSQNSREHLEFLLRSISETVTIKYNNFRKNKNFVKNFLVKILFFFSSKFPNIVQMTFVFTYNIFFLIF